MSKTLLDLILHPIRIRILITMGGREMTAQQLARALPDIAQATLYRQINTLADGGVLKVVAENPVRGTLEKVYALADESALNLHPDALGDLSKEDHMRYFTAFTVTLVQQFARYLQNTEQVDPIADGIGYHTVALYMTDDELLQFGKDLSHLMQAYLEPKDDDIPRSQRLFSTVFMPSDKSDEQSD